MHLLKYTILLSTICSTAFALPKNFVYLKSVDHSIIQSMRYATTDNFVGHTIPGYKNPECILTRPAAKQLHKVQQVALKQGFSLKVYDCYRPRQAVNFFEKWSKAPKELSQKKFYYPRESKSTLFSKGYIADRSGHSRGSTIDLTLVKLSRSPVSHLTPLTRCYDKTPNYLNDNSIDMGTRFDCFDERAQVFNPNISTRQKTNRQLLRQMMLDAGFLPFDKEWWHFTLNNEPYPGTYFDFPVQ